MQQGTDVFAQNVQMDKFYKKKPLDFVILAVLLLAYCSYIMVYLHFSATAPPDAMCCILPKRTEVYVVTMHLFI